MEVTMDIKFFESLLEATVKSGASDLHIKVGSPCMVREGNDLIPVMEDGMRSLDVETIVRRILEQVGSRYGSTINIDDLDSITDFDASYSQPGVGRFRVNIYRQRGTLALTLRAISSDILSIDKLQMPEVLKDIALEPRGLILVTGATGSGKSTTLAAMLDHVNHIQARKIVTIEDPIEHLIRDDMSSISQREVGADTKSFATALRSALRQDPDIIMVGEMRDRATIEIALKASETGHTVFSTVHTRDSVSTIERLLGVFSGSEQSSIRLRLAETLRAIISQRLVPRSDSDGRIAAVEIMRSTVSIQERILSADPRGLSDLIEQGVTPYRMQTFDQHLIELYKNKVISLETAMAAATSPTNLKRNLMFKE